MVHQEHAQYQTQTTLSIFNCWQSYHTFCSQGATPSSPRDKHNQTLARDGNTLRYGFHIGKDLSVINI